MTVDTGNRHIERMEEVVGGKPRIVGRRITVADIAVWHERLGIGVDEISSEYDLSLSQVYGALSYYHDHREEIDDQMRESKAFASALKARTPSKIPDVARGDPAIRHGKPVIRGTSVPVHRIINTLAGGSTPAEICAEYGITDEDVRAALAYAGELVESEETRPTPPT